MMTLDDLGERLFASTNETAEILHNDPRTVRRMIADGTIPARKSGTRHIIPVAWLREFVGAATVAPIPASPNLDDLADRVADRVISRLGRVFAAMAAAEMTAADPAGPAAAADSLPAEEVRRANRTPAA